MCCQESGEREATVQLYCPKASADQPKYRKVIHKLTQIDFNEKVITNCEFLKIMLLPVTYNYAFSWLLKLQPIVCAGHAQLWMNLM